MNRQERRAAERRGAKRELAGFAPFLTYDELSILEEALALWVYETKDDLDGLELTARQRWSLKRAEQLRAGFAAALENRPWYDIAPQREEPPEEKP
jgi:hypothetical protein